MVGNRRLVSPIERNKLLAVVFVASGDDGDREVTTVDAALKGRDIQSLREKYHVIRRPQSDDLGLPTKEADAHRATRSPCVVLLDPWVQGGAPLTTTNELRELRGALERGMLEAARVGHPPQPGRR